MWEVGGKRTEQTLPLLPGGQSKSLGLKQKQEWFMLGNRKTVLGDEALEYIDEGGKGSLKMHLDKLHW